MSMANTSLKFLQVVLLAVLVIVWGNTTAPAKEVKGRGLFVDLAVHATAKDSETEFDPTIVRSRLVKIDWEKLAVTEDSSGRKIIGEDALWLNLFADRSLDARFYRGQARSKKHFTWRGHVKGDKGSQVTMVVQEDRKSVV